MKTLSNPISNSLRHFITTVFVSVLLSLSIIVFAQATDKQDSFLSFEKSQRKLVKSKLKMLDFVLQSSSSVKRIKASNNTLALEELNKAIQARQQAEEYLKQGQYTKAGLASDKGLKLVSSASLLFNKKLALKKKEINNYKNLKATINSFVDTFSKELKSTPSGKFGQQQIDKEMARANEKFKLNQFQQANHILADVYQNLKAFIYQHRNKKTLVYSLDFANDEEEYNYEKKRHHSLIMLLEMSEKKKPDRSDNIRKLVQQFVKKSNLLKHQAQLLAEQKNYRAAINSLEESAKHLNRALRTMGLMIP